MRVDCFVAEGLLVAKVEVDCALFASRFCGCSMLFNSLQFCHFLSFLGSAKGFLVGGFLENSHTISLHRLFLHFRSGRGCCFCNIDMLSG